MQRQFLLLVVLVILVVILLYGNNLYTSSNTTTSYWAISQPLTWNNERNLKEYERLAKRIFDGQLPLKVHINAADNKMGYGNRLYSVINSMIIAILTDSALVVSWGADIGKYIDEPFNRTFYNFAQTKNRFNKDFNPKELLVLNDYNTQWIVKKNLGFNRTLFQNDNTIFFGICSEPVHYQKLFKYGLVKRQTINEAFDSIKNLKSYSLTNNFRSLLQIGYEVAGNLLNKHWVPNEKIRSIIKQIDDVSLKDEFVIGFHLETDFFDINAGLRVYLECALALETMPELQNGAKWLVICNNANLRNLIANEYPDKILQIKYDALNAVEKHIVEIELLSRCDELIITGGSNLGLIAAMKSGKLPLLVDFSNDKAVEKCYRLDLESWFNLKETNNIINKDEMSTTSIKPVPNNERNLQKYIEIHEKILNGKLPPKVHFNIRDSEGYGNRMYSVITSFAIAILSDSALLVYPWGPKIAPYVKEPFYNTFHDYSKDKTPFNRDYDKTSVKAVSYGWGWAVIRNASSLITTKLEDKENVVLQGGGINWAKINFKLNRSSYFGYEAEFFTICSNPSHYQKLYSYGLVKRETVDNAYKIASNSKYSNEEQLRAILQVGFEFGSTILNKYWLLSDEITNKVKAFTDKFFKDNFVVGLQMRNGFFPLEKAGPFFVKCANDIAKRQNSTKNIVWFVATDKDQVYSFMKKASETNTMVVWQDQRGLDDEMARIIDVELLSLTDELIVTGSSTFGFLAAIKSGKLPHGIDAGFKPEVIYGECRPGDLARPFVREIDSASFRK